MNKLKLRKQLVNLHVLFAAFFLPGFLLVAYSGGNYLLGNKGEIKSTPVTIPPKTIVDFSSTEQKEDMQILALNLDADINIESVKLRGNRLLTRPANGRHLQVDKVDDMYQVVINEPNFLAGAIELHKGHGPLWYKTYQKLMALSLILVVLGGFFIGVLSPAYRVRTIGALAVGVLVTFTLLFPF